MARHCILRVSLAAIVASQPAPALGQEPAADWRVECTNTGEALDCSAVQRLVRQDDGRIVTAFSVRMPPETRQPVLLIQLPLGIAVSDPVTLRIDGGVAGSFPIQTCTIAGCFVGAQLSPALLGRMRKGASLAIVVTDPQRQELQFRMPLAGFALAFDKIR